MPGFSKGGVVSQRSGRFPDTPRYPGIRLGENDWDCRFPRAGQRRAEGVIRRRCEQFFEKDSELEPRGDAGAAQDVGAPPQAVDRIGPHLGAS